MWQRKDFYLITTMGQWVGGDRERGREGEGTGGRKREGGKKVEERKREMIDWGGGWGRERKGRRRRNIALE